MDLTRQQQDAIASIQQWWRNPVRPYHLAGYAGTGKTTLARHAVTALAQEGTARYAAYTGKATHVLARKGADPVSTIHSLIYLPRHRLRDRMRDLRTQLAAARAVQPEPDRDLIRQLEAALRAERARLDSPDWLLRTPQESRLTGTRLLVVDEVSMVNGQIARDLAGYGVPILAIGDPMQLPPVRGQAWMTGTPDTLLTEVHRSALDSPVTAIATTVRQAPPGTRGYGVQGDWGGGSGRFNRLPTEALTGWDVVLTGTNQVRWQAIHTLRAMTGLTGPAPVPGDRIIILANNGEADVFNGQTFTVQDATHGQDEHTLTATDDTGDTRQLTVWAAGFTGTEGEKVARRMGGKGTTVAATFGQAITVHKAQGSQWDRVLVVDESDVFTRMARGTATERHRAGQRWLYTAVTRASEQVTLTGSGTTRG